MWHLVRLAGEEPSSATLTGREVAQDSQWTERDPDGVAVTRSDHYLMKDADGDWVFTSDRRDADAYLVQDSDGDYVFDTTVGKGGYLVKVGSFASFKV